MTKLQKLKRLDTQIVASLTDKSEEEVNRLHDMVVHEVSLVDRAANNQKFLLLKRGEQMQTAGAEVVENESGELTTVADPPPAATDAPVVKAGLVIGAACREKVQELATEALKRLTDVALTVKELPDAPGGEAIPVEMAAELEEVYGILMKACDPNFTAKAEHEGAPAFVDNTTKASALRMLSESLERLATVVKSVQAAEPTEKAEGVPEELSVEMTAIANLVGGVVERHTAQEKSRTEKTMEVFSGERGEVDNRLSVLSKAAGALKVSKAGAKISASRLDKLKNIATELLSILKDVAPEAFEALMDKRAQEVKTAKAIVAPTPVVADPNAVDPHLAELAKRADDLAKDNLAKAARIKKLEATTNLPNSMVVESSMPAVPEAPVAWPMDMNSPITKDTIKKGQWFESDK